MTTQQNADRLLIAWQANRHLPAALRARVIDDAILAAANSNEIPADEACYRAQQAAVAQIVAAR